MKTIRARAALGMAAAAVGLLSLSGCQTWVAGMTLPSGRYLEHPPQYFRPSPMFPLTNELARQERDWAAPIPGGPMGVGLPAAVPGAPNVP